MAVFVVVRTCLDSVFSPTEFGRTTLLERVKVKGKRLATPGPQRVKWLRHFVDMAQPPHRGSCFIERTRVF